MKAKQTIPFRKYDHLRPNIYSINHTTRYFTVICINILLYFQPKNNTYLERKTTKKKPYSVQLKYLYFLCRRYTQKWIWETLESIIFSLHYFTIDYYLFCVSERIYVMLLDCFNAFTHYIILFINTFIRNV